MKLFSLSRLLVLQTALLVFSALLLITASPVLASETNGTIVSGGNNGYAWSNQAGWVNFGVANGNIQITNAGITGYAWNSNHGWINMAPTNGGVLVSASGALSGYAWSSGLGWVNFSGVSINSSGKFTGSASGTLVGTLTFDCTNCSVVTDYRPVNFRTVVTTTSSVSSSGGSGGGGVGLASVTGPDGQSVPAHLNAFNVPLKIFNAQSGTLVQNFADGIRAILNIPTNATPARELMVSVTAGDVDISSSAVVQVVGGVVFNIVARDGDGNLVRTFSRPIQIMFEVPEELQGRDDLGVYFLNEDTNIWEKISNVTFTGNTASFFVDHLTLFGIFSASNLPSFITPFFSTEIPTIAPLSPIGTFAPGEAPPELEETIPAQLFDINLEIESTKIADVKDLIARLLFTSFGRVPTPVDITFAVVNKEGQTLYSKKDKITVQTQAVLTERFSDIDVLVPAGKYTLIVTTLYNTNVRDEFKQDFEVTGETIAVPFWRSLWFWVVGGLLLVFLFIIAIKKMGDDDEEDTSVRKFSALHSLLSVRYMKDIR